MKELTSKQKSILDYINDFFRKEGMAPTIYEISDYFGIKSPTAFAHVRALQKKGAINRSSKARSISVVGSSRPRYFSMNQSVPVLGHISAGATTDSPENVERHVMVDSSIIPRTASRDDLFGLVVHGESMRDLGILDGDTVIVCRNSHFSNGDVVVALVDGETTVKSIYKQKDIWELRPANPDFKSRFVPEGHLSVQGVLVGLMRKFR